MELLASTKKVSVAEPSRNDIHRTIRVDASHVRTCPRLWRFWGVIYPLRIAEVPKIHIRRLFEPSPSKETPHSHQFSVQNRQNSQSSVACGPPSHRPCEALYASSVPSCHDAKSTSNINHPSSICASKTTQNTPSCHSTFVPTISSAHPLGLLPACRSPSAACMTHQWKSFFPSISTFRHPPSSIPTLHLYSGPTFSPHTFTFTYSTTALPPTIYRLHLQHARPQTQHHQIPISSHSNIS
jgi:hypothetical protein